MGWVSGISVLFIVWWTVLFVVLPWGNRPDEEPPPGAMPGAPAQPRLWRKVMVTTALAVVVWLVIYGIIESGLVSFRDMAKEM